MVTKTQSWYYCDRCGTEIKAPNRFMAWDRSGHDLCDKCEQEHKEFMEAKNPKKNE